MCTKKQYETEDWEFHSIGNSAIVIPFPNSLIRFMLFTYTLNKSYLFSLTLTVKVWDVCYFLFKPIANIQKNVSIWFPHRFGYIQFILCFQYILISSITQLFYLLKNSHFRFKIPLWILFVTVVFYLLVFTVKQVIGHRTLPHKQSQPAVYIP